MFLVGVGFFRRHSCDSTLLSQILIQSFYIPLKGRFKLLNSDIKIIKQLIKRFPQFTGRTATTDFLTLCYILTQAKENETLKLEIKIDDVKCVLGMSSTTIRKSLNRLVDMEILHRVENTNEYQITCKIKLPTYIITNELIIVYLKYASNRLFRFGNGGLNKSALIIWGLFYYADTISFTEVCKKSFVSKSTVYKKLLKMEKLGLLEQNDFGFSKDKDYFKLEEGYKSLTNI